MRTQFEAVSSGQFQAEYFKTYGEAYLALGQETEAQPLLEHAVLVVETGLKSLRRETEKLSWSRSRSQLYRDLLQVKLKLQTPEQALAWWEWYKGASIRTSLLTSFRTSATADSADAGSDPSSLAARTPPIRLSPGTVLVSYALLKSSVAAFVLRDGTVHLHELKLPNDLEPQASGFLDRCTDPSGDAAALNAEGRRLYDLLVAPLEDDIRGATALRIETDGVLDQIPFAVLTEADGLYLGDKFEIAFSQGTAYGSRDGLGSLAETLSRPNATLIVVASGAQDSSLAPLPEAADEGNEVASHFNQAVIVAGREVTRAEVLSRLQNAEVFHFAGHAVTGINRVGLLLGPDTLLSSSDLAAHRPRNLKLAVLSACDTANGAEGTFADVNSIARTLTAAGVPQVVASRWRIDSAVTRQWMRVFYSTLLSGKTPADSLRTASFTVRRFPGYQHPYYWASFAVFGSS